MVGIRLLSHKSPRSSIHTMFSLCGVFGEVIQRTTEVTTCMHSLTTREREIDFGCIVVRPFVGQYQQQSNREAKQGGEHKLFVDFLEENVRGRTDPPRGEVANTWGVTYSCRARVTCSLDAEECKDESSSVNLRLDRKYLKCWPVRAKHVHTSKNNAEQGAPLDRCYGGTCPLGS